jgi:hypothetical protein
MRYMLGHRVSVSQVTIFVHELIYGGAVIVPVASTLALLSMVTSMG